MMMRDPWLPEWSRLAWAVVLLVVAAMHLGHVVTMHGQRRHWHTGHTLMAAGMAVMYLLPRMEHPSLYRAGLAVYVVVVVALAGVTLAYSRREGVLNPLWVASTVDVLVMVYMLQPGRVALLTGVLVAYLAGQMVAWPLGLWSRVPVLAPAEGGGAPVDDAPSVMVGLTARTSPAVLISLSVMAAGMAYMLLAM